MKQITITMRLVPDSAFTDEDARDIHVSDVLRKLARIGGVGDPTVERPGTKHWVVRDGLGNEVGGAVIE